MSIEVKNVGKTFGDFIALQNVDFQAPTGELVALRTICPENDAVADHCWATGGGSGLHSFNGEDATAHSVGDHSIGFVFQHYALFRHMTVFENVAFGLRVRPKTRRPVEKEIRAKVHELLKLVQLDWLTDRYPSQLSGGQRQHCVGACVGGGAAIAVAR